MRLPTFYSTLATVALVSSFSRRASAQRVCNNAAALCDRAYNNQTYLGAHDSPFVRNVTNGFNPFGDQFYDSEAQLNSGVRLLSMQLYNNSGSEDLCHSLCFAMDAGTLTSWLTRLKGWLDSNPNEVVTILIVNSNNADASTINTQFVNAGIADYGYAPSDITKASTDWPTLSQMIDSGKRLVTFIANLPGSSNTVAPYLLDEFTFVFENDYDNDSPEDFSCEINRPSTLANQPVGPILAEGYMPLMNHFLYDNNNGIESPSVENVNNTNAASGAVGNFGDAAKNCTAFYGRPPVFTLVDFENVARAIDTVDTLNGVLGQTSGRTMLPDTVLESTLMPTPPAPVSSTSAANAAVSETSSTSTSAAPPTTSAATITMSSNPGTTTEQSSSAASVQQGTAPTATETGAAAQLESWLTCLLNDFGWPV